MNNTDVLLKSLTALVASNNEAFCHYGARVAVLSRFVDAVLPLLTPTQCVELDESFRHAIEDVMSLMDDTPAPAGYHSTLLKQINLILDALEMRRGAIR